jgi:hypothetical protein
MSEPEHAARRLLAQGRREVFHELAVELQLAEAERRGQEDPEQAAAVAQLARLRAWAEAGSAEVGVDSARLNAESCSEADRLLRLVACRLQEDGALSGADPVAFEVFNAVDAESSFAPQLAPAPPRSEELIRLLRTPGRIAGQAGGGAPRLVHRCPFSGGWVLSRGYELPPYEPFDDADVAALADAGRLVPAWPGTAAAGRAFRAAAPALRREPAHQALEPEGTAQPKSSARQAFSPVQPSAATPRVRRRRALAPLMAAGFALLLLAGLRPTGEMQPVRTADGVRFGPFVCLEDCSGHLKGYNWAKEQAALDRPYVCRNSRRSFIQGCLAYRDHHEKMTKGYLGFAVARLIDQAANPAQTLDGRDV